MRRLHNVLTFLPAAIASPAVVFYGRSTLWIIPAMTALILGILLRGDSRGNLPARRG